MASRKSPYDVIRGVTFCIQTSSFSQQMSLIRLLEVKGFRILTDHTYDYKVFFMLPER